jgi:hypothetical protein
MIFKVLVEKNGNNCTECCYGSSVPEDATNYTSYRYSQADGRLESCTSGKSEVNIITPNFFFLDVMGRAGVEKGTGGFLIAQ